MSRTNSHSPDAGAPDAERDFYQSYPWCLNLYPTVRKTSDYLMDELAKLKEVRENWQVAEVTTNVFLLSCALLNAVDEYLRGKTLQIPKKAPVVPFLRHVQAAIEKLAAITRMRHRARARRWRESWRAGLDVFLSIFVSEGPIDRQVLADAGDTLTGLLPASLPEDLQSAHIFFPSAFRKHDLTHFDVLALGRNFANRFPAREQPILIVGLRTAGSYFAPVLRAFLKAKDYRTVDAVTVRPEMGAGASERTELNRCARQGYTAVILDDSPRTGDAIVLAVEMARKAGFPSERIVVLVPVHPATREWRNHTESISLSDTTILTLEGEDWHKVGLLTPKVMETRLREYFPAGRFESVSVVNDAATDRFNEQLQSPSEEARRSRLKRVFAVRLETSDGQMETRFVLAKSVGWGWLAYHAFLAGQRLAEFVPPVLGLRDGILFSEWLPQLPVPKLGGTGVPPVCREQWIATSASYVAARTRSLGLDENPTPSLGLHPHHDGIRLLDRVLCRAYGSVVAANLMRPRVRQRLANQPCPSPTLIDGKMERSEWIVEDRGLFKTDYEHHGMGKNELNVVDPAYDLAEVVLRLGLSAEEETQLIRRYVDESGDSAVDKRLFLNKVLAGSWAAVSALKYLFRRPQLPHRQPLFHQDFLDAWHFLTVHAARFCGRHCQPPQIPCWRSPLVVLDIDGVLDRRIFGFPGTTAAGIEALALLHAHEFAVAVNTARSALEVKEYCRAYGFVGGVAEYGAYVWDAVNNRERVLASPESLAQLDKLRAALTQLPGVFLDDRYRYSIRAFTYEDRPSSGNHSRIASVFGALRDSPYDGKYPVPFPTLSVQHLLATLGLDRLRVHQTTIDTTIVAKEVDKGTGLMKLRDFAGWPDMETIAIGDSEPDLPMFREATRSFAPAHIGCARLARSLGCRIARQPYQRGLLEIVRSVIHSGGRPCGRCPSRGALRPRNQDVFLDLLEVADRRRSVGLLRALLDPKAYQVFVR